MVVESTAGNTFKNSSGSTSLKARLYRKGEELDTAGTGYTYKWSKRDKNGVLDANFGGTGNQYKTGKQYLCQQARLQIRQRIFVKYSSKGVAYDSCRN